MGQVKKRRQRLVALFFRGLCIFRLSPIQPCLPDTPALKTQHESRQNLGRCQLVAVLLHIPAGDKPFLLPTPAEILPLFCICSAEIHLSCWNPPQIGGGVGWSQRHQLAAELKCTQHVMRRSRWYFRLCSVRQPSSQTGWLDRGVGLGGWNG